MSVYVRDASNGSRFPTTCEKQPCGDEHVDGDARNVKQERTGRDEADNSDGDEKETEGDEEQQQTSGKRQATHGAHLTS